MNRRSFFTKLAVAAAGFTILPPATTYSRIWKAERKWIPNPAWETAEYEVVHMWRYTSVRALGYKLYEPVVRFRKENGVLVQVAEWVKE